jgi:hypothetical protein
MNKIVLTWQGKSLKQPKSQLKTYIIAIYLAVKMNNDSILTNPS